jgi:hypothetical protein
MHIWITKSSNRHSLHIFDQIVEHPIVVLNGPIARDNIQTQANDIHLERKYVSVLFHNNII